MSKKTISSAALILLSLSLTACSGWGGSGGGSSSDNGTTPNTINNLTNGGTTAGNTGSNNGNTNNANNSNNGSSAGISVPGNNSSRPNSSSSGSSTPSGGTGGTAGSGSSPATPSTPSTPSGPTAEELAQKAAEEAAKNKLEQAKASVTGYFVNNSAAIEAATNEAVQQAIKGTVDNSTGTCDATGLTPTCVDKNLPKGTVLSTEKQSYSSYAVLRETYNEPPHSETAPVNSFVYFVETPTTDKSKVVNADYTGKADLSIRNAIEVAPGYNFKLFVRDSKVTGAVYASGWDRIVVNLNEAEVKVTNGAVGFNGVATFSGSGLNTGFNADFDGTYKGIFAGPNAEEVAGTFESDTIEPSKSVQGVFVGKK